MAKQRQAKQRQTKRARQQLDSDSEDADDQDSEELEEHEGALVLPQPAAATGSGLELVEDPAAVPSPRSSTSTPSAVVRELLCLLTAV